MANLPEGCGPKDIKAFFEPVKPKQIRLQYDNGVFRRHVSESYRSNTFRCAFIQFANTDAAVAATLEKNENDLGGCLVRMNIVKKVNTRTRNKMKARAAQGNNQTTQ